MLSGQIILTLLNSCFIKNCAFPLFYTVSFSDMSWNYAEIELKGTRPE